MKYCFAIFLIFSFFITYSQTSTFNAQGMDMNLATGGFVSQLKPLEKSSSGSAYVYDDYKPATIFFLNDEVVELPVNLNIATGNIEILYDDQIKIGSDKVIKYLEVYNGAFTETFHFKNFSLSNKDFSGIVSEIFQGKNFKVYKLYEFYIKEGYYVPALDVGDDKINYIIKESIAVINNDKGAENFVVATTSKRKFAKSFEKDDAIFSYIKKNNFNLGNENDLERVFEFIDSNL